MVIVLGCLNAGEMMYLTYWLSKTGTTTSATTTPVLPCQRYTINENLNTKPYRYGYRILYRKWIESITLYEENTECRWL